MSSKRHNDNNIGDYNKRKKNETKPLLERIIHTYENKQLIKITYLYV